VYYLDFIHRTSGRYCRIATLIGCAAFCVDAQHPPNHQFPNAADRLAPSTEAWAQNDQFERFGTPSDEPVRPVSGTISVAQLKHRVSSKALREFARADHEMRKKHLEAAIEHLNKAIDIDPAYMEAQNNLGARYIQRGDYEQAVTHLRIAFRLDPTSIFARTNLGMALWLAGDCGEAEQIANDAVRLAPGFPQAQFLLGMILDAKGAPEALEHLEKSAREIPKARLLAAGILMKRRARVAPIPAAAGFVNRH
jgi:tetratricopeptide (TPR) repeat protein